MPKPSPKWNRKETLAAFNLYCRMPFRKVNARNKTIIALASRLGRTSAALSMKMSNLAWHDPNNPSSLKRGSKLDAEIWAQFFADPDAVIFESEQAVAFYEKRAVESPVEVDGDMQIPPGRERTQQTRVRVGQAFFRRAVLAAYQEQCCITGLAVPDLLNASHIIPWRENRERVNPSNGLCLNALHDRAFDRGLITVRATGIVEVSAELMTCAPTGEAHRFLTDSHGAKIQMPDKFKPTAEFLDYHNREIFLGR